MNLDVDRKSENLSPAPNKSLSKLPLAIKTLTLFSFVFCLDSYNDFNELKSTEKEFSKLGSLIVDSHRIESEKQVGTLHNPKYKAIEGISPLTSEDTFLHKIIKYRDSLIGFSKNYKDLLLVRGGIETSLDQFDYNGKYSNLIDSIKSVLNSESENKRYEAQEIKDSSEYHELRSFLKKIKIDIVSYSFDSNEFSIELCKSEINKLNNLGREGDDLVAISVLENAANEQYTKETEDKFGKIEDVASGIFTSITGQLPPERSKVTILSDEAEINKDRFLSSKKNVGSHHTLSGEIRLTKRSYPHTLIVALHEHAHAILLHAEEQIFRDHYMLVGESEVREEAGAACIEKMAINFFPKDIKGLSRHIVDIEHMNKIRLFADGDISCAHNEATALADSALYHFNDPAKAFNHIASTDYIEPQIIKNLELYKWLYNRSSYELNMDKEMRIAIQILESRANKIQNLLNNFNEIN